MHEILNKHTIEDYEQLPEGAPFQLINGELVMSPAPMPRHQRILLKLFKLIDKFVSENQLGEILFSPIDVYLTKKNAFQPDLIFLSKDNPFYLTETKITGPPDLVIEILLPSNAKYDLMSKKKVYEQTGVKEYWIVDPEAKSIEIFENIDLQFVSISKASLNGIVISKVLAGLSFNPENIF
jgi:Uma2 family endonuclease